MMVTFAKKQPQLEVELHSCVINRPQTDGSHTNLRGSSGPFSNEFQGPVAMDLTVRESVCGWCGQAGERRLTAIGGSFHNKGGVFCNPCGQLFLEKIINS
jgi:hypothetical protein